MIYASRLKPLYVQMTAVLDSAFERRLFAYSEVNSIKKCLCVELLGIH